MGLILLVVFYLLAPFFIIQLTRKSSLFRKIGAVLLCYALGFLLGISGLLPEESRTVQDIITSATVPLALPLLLFGTHIKSWIKMAGKTFLSMTLAATSLVMVVTVAFLLFQKELDNAWKIGGLLIGLYTGGTPNLASIQAALEVKPEIYLMVNTYDIVLSSIFLLIVMSTGGRFLRFLLPAYQRQHNSLNPTANYHQENPESYKDFFQKRNLSEFAVALGAAILITGISVGLSFIITGKISMLIIILGITSLSLLGSLIPRLNQTKKSFEGGMYLILVFSLTVASMVTLDDFIHISPMLFLFVAVVIFGNFILHILFSALFKIDADTTLITATAMICSPPFVPVVSGALKNKEIIVSGLSVGIIGYAIGNYLGVAIAYLLHSFI
ncbi:MAG: hypothetical protein CSA04_03770 [Bacteroidetes bacterium]|nr:MAG: hypothetical protein CSA04_03770 [Bacteroidota bacterium]